MAMRGVGRRGARERWWETVALGLGLAGALLAGGADPARADGGGGGGGGGSAATPAKPRDPAYQDAVAAIERGDPGRAIGLLQGVVQREPTNADAWNWLAYATRQTGDATKALPLYEKALAIDPKHRGAHEYIGEAYLILGDLPKARQHLAQLDKLCFFPCSEYRDLKKAVEAYEKSGGQTRPSAHKTP